MLNNSIKKYLHLGKSKDSRNNASIFCHSLKDVSKNNFHRESLILELSKKRRVIHFGFLDKPFLEEKINNKSLLHLKLREQATKVWGIDIDKDQLEKYRIITNDKDNCIFDIQKKIKTPDKLVGYDLILFPEVLEHIINPGIALTNLRHLSLKNNNAMVCITVPNAFNSSGYTAALEGYELVHPDHYFYFSPVTLKKILNDTGFKNIEILLYSHEKVDGDGIGITNNGVIALCKAQ